MCYVIRELQCSEVQHFDHLYLVKEIYFDKKYRRKDVPNDVVNNQQYSTLKISLNSPDKLIRGWLLKSFLGYLKNDNKLMLNKMCVVLVTFHLIPRKRDWPPTIRDQKGSKVSYLQLNIEGCFVIGYRSRNVYLTVMYPNNIVTFSCVM